MRDHIPIHYTDFRGNFHRAPGSRTPPNYFIGSQNIVFYHRAISTRPRIVDILGLPTSGPLRLRTYQRTDESTPRYIVLGPSGEFFDSGAAVPSTPILTVASATDFSMTVIANRCYIVPFKYTLDEAVPISGEKVYVYDGTGLARAAAGTPATGGTMAAATGAAGRVEAGRYIIAVAFETASGFITAPGPETFIQYTAPGGFKIDLTNINTGPSGTAARWILISKAIFLWDGNQRNYELFKFLRISGNVTTTATLDFYLAELIDSGLYLYNQLSTIPSGVGVGIFEGRLISWGEFGNESLIRVSKPGDYESISSVDGFISMYPGDGGGLKNCLEHRGTLYAFKSARCFASQSSFTAPSAWPTAVVDSGLGAEPHSIAKILDAKGPHREVVLVANRNGLYKFDGQFSDNPLSWNIVEDWKLIRKEVIPKIEVIFGSNVPIAGTNNPVVECAFIAVSLLEMSTVPDRLLMMDYSEGLEPETVRWTHWTFKATGESVDRQPLIEGTPKGLVIAFRTFDRLCQLDSVIDGTDIFNNTPLTGPILQIIDSPKLPWELFGIPNIHHFGAFVVGFGASGNGSLKSFITIESTGTGAGAGPTLTIPASHARVTKLLNVISELMTLRLYTDGLGEFFRIHHLTLYYRPLYGERPM